MTKEQKLNEQVSNQQKVILRLSNRVNELSDRIAILENNVNRFRQNVAKDMKKVVEIATS
tara:strand:- start:515 stop:694 length:180 start_codon:yes stop_codon:yes gene_type:complete